MIKHKFKHNKDHYEYIKFIKREAKKFRLSSEDLHNLHDLLYMVDTPIEVHQDIRETLKLNNMYEWVLELRKRIEDVVIWELKLKGKKDDKL